MANTQRGDSSSPLQHHAAQSQRTQLDKYGQYRIVERSAELDQHLPSAPHPQGFFFLPPELRAEVYRHVITDTLFEGITSNISGLFLACHTTHAEMEPMIDNVKTLLNVKHTCDILKSKHKGVIKFVLPRNYAFLTPFSNLTVWIPNIALEEIHRPWGIGKRLRALFELPLDSVTLEAYNNDSGSMLEHDLQTIVSFIFMANRQKRGFLTATTRVKKLILFESVSIPPQHRRKHERMFVTCMWHYVRAMKINRPGIDKLAELAEEYTVDGDTGKCWGIHLEKSVFAPPVSD